MRLAFDRVLTAAGYIMTVVAVLLLISDIAGLLLPPM